MKIWITALLAFALCLGSVLATVGPSCDGCSSPNGCNTCAFNSSDCCIVAGMTKINGVIYEGNLSNGIKGAYVTVTCYHNGSEYTRNALSWYGGKYMVFFPSSQCEYGDEITVSAQKNGLTGTNSSIVDTRYTAGCFTLDVGIVNVPLIPEFGMIIGTLTVVSAIGVFFLIRRK